MMQILKHAALSNLIIILIFIGSGIFLPALISTNKLPLWMIGVTLILFITVSITIIGIILNYYKKRIEKNEHP